MDTPYVLINIGITLAMFYIIDRRRKYIEQERVCDAILATIKDLDMRKEYHTNADRVMVVLQKKLESVAKWDSFDMGIQKYK